MRYGMKKLFIFIIVLTTVLNSVQASVVDQSQEQFDPSLFVICSDWLSAQTFTAGMDGHLEKVDLYLTNTFATDLYPCTISIVNVINEIPSGSILGEVFKESLVDGWNGIDFSYESVFLASGTKYGIVVSNDDTERYSGISTQWCSKSTDVYTGGSAWILMPDTGWVQSVQTPGELLPVETFYDKDTTFKTYMIPEPATIILFSLGGFALLKNRKSR